MPYTYDTYLNSEKFITTNGLEDDYITPISQDLDIFSELPDDIFNNECIMNFKSIFEKYLRTSDFTSITLPKLIFSKDSNGSINLELIFSYFRLYYHFSKEKSTYGFTEYIEAETRFSTSFSEMTLANLNDVVEKSIDYIKSRLHV